MSSHQLSSGWRVSAVAALGCLLLSNTVSMAETRRAVEVPSITSGQPLTGILFTPDAAEPKPAIIVLAPGGGVPEPADERYARDLAKNGYVALAVSYQVNGVKKGVASWSPRVTSDLVGVVNWLRALPEVGGKPVGTVGFSAGSHGLLLGARTPAVRAMVVYYGGYNIRKFAQGGQNMPKTTRIPIDAAPEVSGAVLLLHGDKDDEIPVKDAEETRDAMKSAGKTVELVVYPGAYHRFERGNVPGRSGDISGRGFTYREDPAAARDAFDRTLAWFGKYLASAPAASAGSDNNPVGSTGRTPSQVIAGGDDEPVGPTGRTPSQVIAGSDKDGDGRVSRAEFKGPAVAFDRIDADKDGFLTKTELRAAYSKAR